MLIASFFTFDDKASRGLNLVSLTDPRFWSLGGGGKGGGIDASTDNFSPTDKLETWVAHHVVF